MNKILKEWRKVRLSSAARNVTWMLMGQGSSVACQAVYFMLLGRLLGSTEYGIYMGAVALVSILSQYSALGSHWVFLRHVSPDPKQFAPYWGNILMSTLSLGSLFTAALTWGGPYVAPSYSHTMLVCVAAADCLCLQVTTAVASVFQAFERLRVTASMGLLVNLFRVVLAGSILVYLHHVSARQWVVAALAVSLLAAALAIISVTHYYGKPEFSLKLLKERTGEGAIFALSSSAGSIYNDFDKVMLGHYGMNMANGIYSMAYKVVNICTMPISAIHAAVFPRIFRRGADGVTGTGTYAVRILKRTAPLGLLLAASMWITAPLIPRLVGPTFTEGVTALRWLCLLPFFRAFQFSAGDALTGAGHQKLRLGVQAVAAIFNFGVNLYLIPRYGWYGAAWSSLATDGMLGAFNWIILLKARISRPPKLVNLRRSPKLRW